MPCSTMRYSPVVGLTDSTLHLQVVELYISSVSLDCNAAGEHGVLSNVGKFWYLNFTTCFHPL
ncbi:MAG TPA: hypothetical protein VF369_02235 [candidate division Zixibacteria bacterium]